MSMSRFWHYQQLMLQLQMAIWKLIINEIIQNMFKKNNFSRECPKAAKQLTENGSHLEFLINTWCYRIYNITIGFSDLKMWV